MAFCWFLIISHLVILVKSYFIRQRSYGRSLSLPLCLSAQLCGGCAGTWRGKRVLTPISGDLVVVLSIGFTTFDVFLCLCIYTCVYIYIQLYIIEFCVCSVRACWSPIHKLDDIPKYCSMLLLSSVAAVSTCSSFTLDMFQKLGEALSLFVSQAIGHIFVDPATYPFRVKQISNFPEQSSLFFRFLRTKPCIHGWKTQKSMMERSIRYPLVI